MTLRRDVVVLEEGRTFAENVQLATANQYTRYPLVEPGSDKVIGYVHLKDIVAALAAGRTPSACARSRASLSTARRRRPANGCAASSSVAGSTWRWYWAQQRLSGSRHPGRPLGGIRGEIQDEQDVGELPPIMHGAEVASKLTAA